MLVRSVRAIAEYQNGAAPSSPTREYIYSGGALLAKIESGAVQYCHPDQLSVRLMTDSGGNVVGQQAHYPFGESWYQTNTTTKWFFTAGVYPERSRRERDAESGNDYAMARYGVNRFGRFASPDPIAGSRSDPQSLNRYPYVRDDPVNLVDPLGLTDCTPTSTDGFGEDGSESSGDGDPYFEGFGAPCLGDATACGQAGFFGGGGYGGTLGDGVPRNTAMCNVDPFCIEAGGFDMWNSPVAQSSCVYDNQGNPR